MEGVSDVDLVLVNNEEPRITNETDGLTSVIDRDITATVDDGEMTMIFVFDDDADFVIKLEKDCETDDEIETDVDNDTEGDQDGEIETETDGDDVGGEQWTGTRFPLIVILDDVPAVQGPKIVRMTR